MTGNQMDGTFHGPAVQAAAIHGDIHFHGARPTPPAAPAPPPADWTELPELPPAVRHLLRAQVQAAQDLPYRLPGARRPSLATVYVRQDLGTGTEDQAEPARPEPILDSRGQLIDSPNPPVARLAVRPPSRTVTAALDGDDHLLVTGGPGQGKSTLSLRLAADIAARWTGTGPDPLAEPVVPVRLTARELATRLDLMFPDAVARSVHAEYGARLVEPLEPAVIRERVAGCRWLMLVDGLDEVADSAVRDKLVSILATWASDDSPYRIVLTTRPIEGAALAPLQRIGAARYELQPFDQHALRQFAVNWFEDDAPGERFVRQIHAAHLDELVRVPLLATIAAIIFEQHDDRPLPDNQYSLYEAYLKYLRSAHTSELKHFDNARGTLLEHLGVVRLETDTSLVTATLDWAARHLPDCSGDDLVTYLAAVGPVTRRGDDLVFLHHSFAEHLAATAKARLLPTEFAAEHPEFARLLHAGRPDERGRYARAVLLHYTRLHPAEADALIRWLRAHSAEEHLLAARLLAGHVPASPEVVDAFLTTARGWARTTRHPALRILQQASRATHHRGIADWLVEIMRDSESPWQSRVEAATALATRLRGDASAEAIVHLRQVVDDESIAITHRLSAAEALSDCDGEREIAERGLRAVLADPDATGRQCRNAALILANFDEAARAHAVEVLLALLDDPVTPDADLVEAANGLVEIGVEFHDRCAEVFRAVLTDGPRLPPAVDAALALAALGPDQLAEAADALTGAASDCRSDTTERTRAARALAKLGPQHRKAAADLVLAMAAEFSPGPPALYSLAEALANLGLRVQAADLLRKALSDPASSANNRYWAAHTFAELGSEYRTEAAEIYLGLVQDPRSEPFERAGALGALAELGEPHRDAAVAALRRMLKDSDEWTKSRCEAAAQLIRLGPEYHDEVTGQLLAIVSSSGDPGIRTRAWQILLNNGTRYARDAAQRLATLLGPEETVSWEDYDDWPSLNGNGDDREPIAVGLIAAANDPSRKGMFRRHAAYRLAMLGRRHHQSVLAAVVDMLGSPDLAANKIWPTISGMTALSGVYRAEIAGPILSKVRRSNVTASDVLSIAEALWRFGVPADSEIVERLRHIVADDVVDVAVRTDAAVALAHMAPHELEAATDLVLRLHHHGAAYSWRQRVIELAWLGADVVPYLRTVMANPDARRAVREEAAFLLADNPTVERVAALEELEAQARDEFLEFYWSTDAAYTLARVDRATVDRAVRIHKAILDDERQPVRDRCEAADQLAELDRSCAPMAAARLRHFVSSLDSTPEDRAVGMSWLPRLGPFGAPEQGALALALVSHPETKAGTLNDLARRLRNKPLMVARRMLLADSTLPVRDRVDGITVWDKPWLADEAEAVIREVLAAVETSPVERVDAAVALAGLSPRHVPEALRLLEDMSSVDEQYGLRELCDLSHSVRRRVADEAMATAESGSWRQRLDAVDRLLYLMPHVPDSMVGVVRAVVADRRTSDQNKLTIRVAMVSHDGLGSVRAMRDDPRASDVVRWLAADKLRKYDIADRAQGARVLHAIATSSNRPSLRWRAARDLLKYGPRGRDLAVPVLLTLLADENTPTLARANAARTLTTARPDLRGDVLRQLRRLRTVKNPLVRIQVIDAIGQIEPSEAVRYLAAMIQERDVRQGARLRAATAMMGLRRDYREKAAVVAREVAHDETAPWHVRVKAARSLARWSELCRAEARDVLRGLAARRL